MTYITGTGQKIVNVHDEADECREHGCVIHNPTDHPMSDFPTHWREATFYDIKPSHMERICPHGVGHPDPDSLRYAQRHGLPDLSVHGCDGCCT